MKIFIICMALFLPFAANAQQAMVDVSLRPAGSFKVKANDIKGVAQKKADHIEAHNVIVNLRNIQTGISLRDEHTKKHLETEKYPEAVLVSAEGKDGKGEGVLRIKGIEHKIQGTYEVQGSNLIARFGIKLSDYKIDGIKYMGVGVSDDVKMEVKLPLEQN